MLELCRVTTADGLQLDGSWLPSASAAHPTLLLIHGTGSNFYGSGILATVASEAAHVGYPVLRINTRGHDLAASIPGSHGSVKGGAAHERVLDCTLDISAWCDFLVARGHPQIILIGHSLGGVKAIWSQHLARHPGVSGIVGISPPRFVHQKFQADPRCDAFRKDFTAAEQLIAAGRPEAFLSITQPLPMFITAAGFLEKYGPTDPLDYVPILPRIDIPKLVLVGSQSVESNPAFADLPAAFAVLAETDPRFQSVLIPQADINYRNNPTEVWRIMREWMEQI